MLELYSNIRKLRKLNMWSQEELAQRMGYTDRSMIAKIESGKVDLSYTKILEFAEVFNVDADDLMGNKELEASSNGFSKMLKSLRKRENLSQRELATSLGISASAIAMYESGQRRPRPADEEMIAEYFGVDLDTLRGRKKEDEIAISPKEKKIIQHYRRANKNTKEIIEKILFQ